MSERIYVAIARSEGMKGVTTLVILSADKTSKVGRVTHDNPIKLQESIIRGVDAWMRSTQQGRAAWEYSDGDFNIGDLSSHLDDPALVKCLECEGVTGLELIGPEMTTDWQYDTRLTTIAEDEEWADTTKPDGWVFVDDESQEEVGHAKPCEYRTAEDAVHSFGNEYGDGDFGVYFRIGGKLNPCSPEDSPATFGFFIKGEKVMVDRQDDQWGRIAEEGEVTEVYEDKVLVLVGGNIRADVLCEFHEVCPLYDPETDGPYGEFAKK